VIRSGPLPRTGCSRHEYAGVEHGAAREPHAGLDALAVERATVLETESKTYNSRDVTRWAPATSSAHPLFGTTERIAAIRARQRAHYAANECALRSPAVRPAAGRLCVNVGHATSLGRASGSASAGSAASQADTIARMRFRVAVVAMSAGVASCLSACGDDLFENNSMSLMAYTCTKPALRDASQLVEALEGIGLGATLIPACDSGWAYVRFKPTVSVAHTATELTRVFNCEEVANPGFPQNVALRCKIDQSRFLAVLSWDERRLESGRPVFRLDAEAILVRGDNDEDVILGPTPE
jgi:hypothetical protein